MIYPILMDLSPSQMRVQVLTPALDIVLLQTWVEVEEAWEEEEWGLLQVAMADLLQAGTRDRRTHHMLVSTIITETLTAQMLELPLEQMILTCASSLDTTEMVFLCMASAKIQMVLQFYFLNESFS